VAWLTWLILVLVLGARGVQAEIHQPLADTRQSISIAADRAQRWRKGSYEVWVLQGNCLITQGLATARSQDAVVWIDRAAPMSGQLSTVISYLEGNVAIDHVHQGDIHRTTGLRAQSVRDKTWLGRFRTTADIELRITTIQGEPQVKPELYRRGVLARNPEPAGDVRPAQFLQPSPPGAEQLDPTARRIQVVSRSSVPMQFEAWEDPSGQETVAVITSGVKVVVEGIENVEQLETGTIDVEADRIVIWTANVRDLNFGGRQSGQAVQRKDTPLEFYLEGNIVFREGDRVIYAQRMYYNVTGRYGVIQDAEMLTPVRDFQGLLRVKAEVLQQLDAQNFLAHRAAATSSRLGTPQYWFQSDNIALQDVQTPIMNPFTGQPEIDPVTGELAVDHQLLATARNNLLYVGGFPVFYWPVMATDVTKPSYYVDQISLKNDSVFGFQTLIDFDLYQLLGMANAPAGTEWTLSTDYLSERGMGLGTEFSYERDGLLGLPGPYDGFLDAWGIHDTGLDNLGADRRAVVPATEDRGRILWRHRHYLPDGYQLTGELGLISDRNFLEQYYEQEWDQEKDQITGLELKRYGDNSSWSVTADVRLNDFFTQTESLPAFDHYLLGQSFLFDLLTWSAHSHVGYHRLRTAELPPPGSEPTQVPLPWETTTAGVQYDQRVGLNASTRQELDLPLEMGPVKVVPYVLGEVAFWGEDRDGEDLTRALGQTGVRASMPMWAVNPDVHNGMLNLNGLAHKVVLDAELLWADANQELDQLPLYNPLDDDATEHFRRRFAMETFGGMTPQRFDERPFALRSGMQSWVTASSNEVADDLALFRAGVRQRFQTKRGMPGQERIIDWIVFDVEGTFFPNADRDNFGENLGLVNYDFRWHIGDRLSLLSDGFFDFFSDGLKTATLGGMISRPELGNLYLGVRSIEGPISSNVLVASVNYRMSEKWIVTAGSSVDFAETGNIGQTLAVTRIGESFLIKAGVNVDSSRDNVNALLTIEPRFLPNSRLSRLGGVQIPPAGWYRLE
jgi:hypothetical protein